MLERYYKGDDLLLVLRIINVDREFIMYRECLLAHDCQQLVILIIYGEIELDYVSVNDLSEHLNICNVLDQVHQLV